jgi:glucosamine kinase
MKILAGIDGGGTHTRLALVREDGVLLAFAEGGCCSFVELGLEAARQALGDLWQRAWTSAPADPRPAEALFIGTGSVLSETDERTNCDLAIGLGLARPGQLRAGNDALNALAGGLSGGPGILLIAGTGSACLGRNAQGETWRAGGWGHLLHDAGSAYALGRAAMIAATRDTDGRGQPTALTALVRESLHLGDLREIYRKVHHEGVSRADVAALAPRVVALAEAGDAVAQQLLGEGVRGLVEMVATVARQLGLERPKLALTGGLITQAARYRRMFLDQLGPALPGFTLASGGFAPVLGAVILACAMATGAAPTAGFLENLRHSTARLELAA